MEGARVYLGGAGVRYRRRIAEKIEKEDPGLQGKCQLHRMGAGWGASNNGSHPLWG